MKLNITSIYENKIDEYLQYSLKKDDSSYSSSVTYESKLKINFVDSFNAEYIKDPEFLTIKYKNL